MDRKAELEDRIKTARHSYYNAQPIISDEEYDALVDELSDIDAFSDIARSVGAAPVSEWSKVKHGIPMGSLDKVNELGELTDWIQSCASGETLLVTEKLDGISIHLGYVGGKLIKAVTRGDGHIGEDITQNVLKMQGVPSKLPEKFTGSIRGEILLLKSDHKAWFPEYSNPRNAASGIARRYDGRGSEHLTVYVYRVAEGKDLATEEEQFKFLASLGFNVPTWQLSAMTMGVKTPHDIWVDYQQGRRDRLNYEIDGLVVNINDLSKQLALGDKDLRPRGCIAFKFTAITRESTARKIQWQTGGTGRITPVAVFDPVNLLGAQVSYASLYNIKYIEALGFDVGASILVARANDVIPRVVSVSKSTGTVAKAPVACETCGGAVARDGEYVVCTNREGCSAQVAGRLGLWISEQNILEFGNSLLEKLVASGKVKTVPDLYRLTVEDIASLDRLGEKTATKALDNLKAKSPLPLENFLGGLSIPGVATSTIRVIMEAGHDTLGKIQALTEKDLAKIKGIGPVRAETLSKWLVDNKPLLEDLASVLPISEPIRGKFSGKTFCFTGASALPRPQLEALVVAQGGTVKSSAGKTLTYLVMADPSLATTKAQAAKKNGTSCISEQEFMDMVNGLWSHFVARWNGSFTEPTVSTSFRSFPTSPSTVERCLSRAMCLGSCRLPRVCPWSCAESGRHIRSTAANSSFRGGGRGPPTRWVFGSSSGMLLVSSTWTSSTRW